MPGIFKFQHRWNFFLSDVPDGFNNFAHFSQLKTLRALCLRRSFSIVASGDMVLRSCLPIGRLPIIYVIYVPVGSN
ncbi:MAG: hypothetical protein K0R65_112 [Crocinitomicaceae bacterium]|jgi:hypothetical protein|nr:hypothetical protein [Crocinitomicaceae bacterium]